MKTTLHVVSLPHTQTTTEYSTCAFTQKVYKFCKMMRPLGYNIIHYGGEGSEADCDDHVSIITNEERKTFFGHNDWKKDLYDISFDSNLPYWQIANQRTIEGIKERATGNDIICVIGGIAHKPIADALPGMKVVEFGIGYSGVFADFKVFESYSWMHYLYGANGVKDGKYYDAVIPNYFDPADFHKPKSMEQSEKPYMLYLGRLISRKGLDIAVMTARESGKMLVMAGQGGQVVDGVLITQEGDRIELKDDIKYVGAVGIEERAMLMYYAESVIMPTKYIEPFGGVAVEAMLSGTPVITSDFGAFTETVKHGVTGYRCKTLEQFVWAAKNIHNIVPEECRDWAEQNYSMERIGKMYDEYFKQIMMLDVGGRYATNEDRKELEHLQKF